MADYFTPCACAWGKDTLCHSDVSCIFKSTESLTQLAARHWIHAPRACTGGLLYFLQTEHKTCHLLLYIYSIYILFFFHFGIVAYSLSPIILLVSVCVFISKASLRIYRQGLLLDVAGSLALDSVSFFFWIPWSQIYPQSSSFCGPYLIIGAYSGSFQ